MDYELISKIKDNVDIVEFISKYIPLVKKGKNYFGLCPFHSDNNPSLSVSREKQIYKCFVCGEAGNVFNFIEKYENVSYKEAIKIVGNSVGIITNEIKIENNKNQVYYDMYDLANKFYQNNLFSNLGTEARDYLEKRKLDFDTIKKFKIGLSLNNNDSLYNLLLKKGYSLEQINNSGLVRDNHDIYINRIIFPLNNVNGLINGFSGRIYHGENLNKYLNTSETPIFKKGENIYNYFNAKEEVRKKKYVILMEGFMAVIRASTIGVSNCIATMGTSLTKDQIGLIKRLTNTVYLCLDGDNAGVNATINNGKLLLDNNLIVKVIPLTDNLDPDDYIIKYGKEKFLSLIDNPMNYEDFKIRRMKLGVNFNSSEELASYVNNVLEEISLVNDEIKKEIMLKNLAKETNVWYNTLEKKLNELLSKKQISKNNLVLPVKNKKKKNKYVKTLEFIIYYMLIKKEVITLVENSHVYFPIDDYRKLSLEIINYYNKYGVINISNFLDYMENVQELKPILKEIISLDLDDNVSNQTILDYLKVINDYNITLEIKRLEQMIMNEVDPIEQAKISNKIRNLKMGSENND